MPNRTLSFTEEAISYGGEKAKIDAVLYRPLELTGPAPAVVFCPGARDELTTMEFLPQAYARHGYVVIASKYRGTAWDTDDADVSLAIDHLESLAEVDKGRIGGVGHFRGGNAVLRSAIKDKRIRSIVSLSAPVFLAQWVNGCKAFSTIAHKEMLELIGGGAPETQQDRYKELSPIFSAPQIKAPVLLVHGTMSLWVPIEQALWMYTSLGHGGNANVKLEFPIWAGHFFDHAMNGTLHDHVADVTRSWLDETLGAKWLG